MYLQHWMLTVRMICLLFRSVAMSNYQNLDHSEDLIFIELEVTGSLFYQNDWMWIFAKFIIFFSPLGTKQCKINNILLIPGHKAVDEASNKFFSYVFLFKLLAHLSWKLKWAFLITCRPSVCLSVCKLFTFSSSSPEPLGQFQPNLAQSIRLGWRRFNFVQMKGPALFQGEIITK